MRFCKKKLKNECKYEIGKMERRKERKEDEKKSWKKQKIKKKIFLMEKN